MKKLILALLVAAGLSATAQDVSVLLSGQQTNSTLWWGSNSVVVLNRLGANQSFTALSLSSNLAYIATNDTTFSPKTTLGVVAGFYSASVGTNTYTLQRAYLTTGPWDAWTNFSLFNPASGRVQSNYTLTIGDYHYFKVSDITNAAAAACASNYLSFHQK